MELDPELNPQKPAPIKKPNLHRPVPDTPASQQPELLASRSQLEAEPPSTPAPIQPAKTNPLLFVMLLLLMIGGSGIHLSKDVKTMSGPAPSGPIEFVENEIVVDLNDDITNTQIAALNIQYGIQLRYNSIHSRTAKLMIAKVTPDTAATVLAGLRASNLVQAAERNGVSHIDAAPWRPNDPDYPRQWHLQMLHLEDAWAETKGDGAIVAVVDTGVGQEAVNQLRKLSDFAQTKFVPGYDFVDKDDVPQDAVGHGSHVAGTIAESTDNGILGAGVAPLASIMPIRVCSEKGCSTSNVVDGIRFAADNGAHVINLSLGSYQPSTVEQLALQHAVSKGVTILCSAGNDSKPELKYPGRFPECISISAVGPDRQLAYYSNHSDELGLAAPGGNTRQGDAAGVWQNTVEDQGGRLVEGFFPLQGTSMATPHVTGVAALLVSLGVKDPNEIRTILRKSAAVALPVDQYGAGVLDAAAAVQSTGKKVSQKRNNWIVLGVAGLILLFFTGKENAVIGLVFLAAGFYFPTLMEKVTKFGAVMNIAGHSVVLPVIWLLTPQLSKSTLISAGSLTLGLAVHFGLDLESGVAPFQVISASRINLWFCLNLAIAAYLILSAALRMGSGKR